MQAENMAQTTSSERNVRSDFAEFLKTIQENNNEETDEFLSSVTGTAGTYAKQRGATTLQDLSTKLEDALRKSDVVAICRLFKAREEIKTLASLQVAERVKSKEDEGLCATIGDSLRWISPFYNRFNGEEQSTGDGNVHEKVWINILTDPLYICLEWLCKSSAKNKTEITDVITAALEDACLLEKIASNERHFDQDEYRERAKECEKFAIDIVEQINASDSGKLHKIMDIKEDGPLVNGNHKNFNESLSLVKIAADKQRKMFVTSPKCQLILDEVVYREWPMWHDKGPVVMTLRFFSHFIFVMSFGIIVYLPFRLIMRGCYCCKLNEVERCWKLRKLFELPYSKFINQTMSYLTFLCLVFASTFETTFGTTKTGLAIIDFAILAFVVGFTVQEAMEAYGQGCSIYFSKWWNVVDTLIAITFLLAYVVWLGAWGFYGGWKPRKVAFIVADAIYATATVLSYFHLAHIFQVNSVLGPLQLSLYRMLKDVLKFLAIFLLLYIAFATGVAKIYSYYVASQLELQNQDYNKSTEFQASHPYGRHTDAFIGMFWLLLGMVEEDKIAVDDPAFNLTSTFGRIFMIGHVICTVIVALNMLIAMMNNSFEGIMENAIQEWKFSRTQMWLEWIDKGNSIPVPFNVAYYIFYIFTPNFWKTCCKTCCKNAGEGDRTTEMRDRGEDNHGAQTDGQEGVGVGQTRAEVMNGLVMEYLADRYADKWEEHWVNT